MDANFQNNLKGDLSAIIDFGKLINSSLNLDFVLNNLLLTCFGKFHTTKGIIAIFENDELVIKSVKGFKNNIIDSFPRISNKDFLDCTLLNDVKKKYGIEICKEINSVKNTLGLLLLGRKFTGQNYSEYDVSLLETLVNIGSSAIENCITYKQISELNAQLDSKINQLKSLFDLSKEFSSILESERVIKLLVYSVLAQMLITKYSILFFNDGKINIKSSGFSDKKILQLVEEYKLNILLNPVYLNIETNYPNLYSIGIRALIPLVLKSVTKGILILGDRFSGKSFTDTDIEYLYSLGSIASISVENSRLVKEEIEKEKLEKDLELAKNIQKNLLPKELPKFENLDIAALNKTAKMVGGDYYGIFNLSKEKVIISIADVSGKGVQAALLMANLQAFLKSALLQKLSITELVGQINNLVTENVNSGSFITFFISIVDLENLTLEYVNAGHNPPYFIRNGKLEQLKHGGMILGVMETIIPYTSGKLSLLKGDTFVLFTDGITEATNAKEEEYGEDRFEKFSLTIYENTCKEMTVKIEKEIEDFTNSAEQSDDITLVIFKII